MNRTQYRRQHQAIQTSVENLGFAILFPKKITMKNPQINFILSESFKRAYFEKSKRSFQFLKNGLNHHCSGGSKHRPEISTHAAQETTEPQQEEGSCFVTPLNTAQIPALKLGTSSAWWHLGVCQIISVAFLLFLASAGGSTPVEPIFQPRGAIIHPYTT